MKSKKNAVLISIIVLFALAFAGACVFLVLKGVQNSQSSNEYNQIASSFASDVSAVEDNTEITSPTEIDIEKAENPIDFASLTEKNSDIYSWIYIPETNINYPVCRHATEDNFYLEHDIYKNYSFSGAIYSQFCNGREYNDRVTVLYGHNMADGSMFADLHKFKDKDFFDKNKYMYIYTPDRKLTYEIVSAFAYDDRHIINTFDFSNDAVFKDYLSMIKNPRSVSSNTRDDVLLDIDDKIVVLSTCLNSGEGRFLVQGVLVNDGKTE
ncbi:MAG: class B sortase [Ruminococcus sp.]|nr:class B sortase [Ruminococcus sp.]